MTAVEERIFFKSFSSGSCGNCCVLGVMRDGQVAASILIDAGVSRRRVRKELEAEHLALEDLSGILLTHDHLDHVRSLGSFCKYDHIPVYASPELHKALARRSHTLGHLAEVRRVLARGEWNEIVPGLVQARYFVVPHDASHTVGYDIRMAGHAFVLITDCGRLTDEALDCAAAAHTLVIESNYDREMLANGPYTPELQERIRGGHGHTSNDECAYAIGKVWHEGLRHIYLCHISENNNTPEKAYRASASVLEGMGFHASYERSSLFIKNGTSLTLMPLPRRSHSPLFTL